MQWYLLNKKYLDYLREFDSLKRNQRLLITVLDEFIDTGVVSRLCVVVSQNMQIPNSVCRKVLHGLLP